MPYGITQCYLPPGRGDIPAFTPVEAGTRFSDPGGMQAKLTWVVVTSQDSLEISKQCHDRDSNQRREGHKSNVLTTTLMSHLTCFSVKRMRYTFIISRTDPPCRTSSVADVINLLFTISVLFPAAVVNVKIQTWGTVHTILE